MCFKVVWNSWKIKTDWKSFWSLTFHKHIVALCLSCDLVSYSVKVKYYKDMRLESNNKNRYTYQKDKVDRHQLLKTVCNFDTTKYV